MRVGIIGGLDRSELAYRRVAGERGDEVLHHTGDMHGNGSASLEHLVERSDLVVILTDINSHGAVQTARKLLRQHPRPTVLVRRLGPSRLSALLDAAHADPPAAASARRAVGV